MLIPAKADAGLNPGGESDNKMKMLVVKDHFPGYLLRVLYSNKAYSCLRHFVDLFEELVVCGCKAPCDLPSFRKFAEADLLGAEISLSREI